MRSLAEHWIQRRVSYGTFFNGPWSWTVVRRPVCSLWDCFTNSEATRLFIFPTSVLGSSFVTVFAGCGVLYSSSGMSLFVCTVTMYLWKQRMSNILHWVLSFIPVGYLSAWIMPSRLNCTIYHGMGHFSAWTFIYVALIISQSNLYLLGWKKYWWKCLQMESLVTRGLIGY